MRPSLPSLIRRAVLLALAPAPAVACGDSSAEQVSVKDAGAVTDVGRADDATGAGDQGATADATTDSTCTPGGCGVGCAPACDPAPYEDGGSGACAARWIAGDGCKGGQVLFPCGLPTTPLPDPTGSSYGICATYCMGSDNFNGCRGIANDGGFASGPLGGGGLSSYADAGTTPVVIACYFDCTGRRPVMAIDDVRSACSAGEVLARAAYLESASVVAFNDLAEQLDAHGAPRALVRRLRRAAKDEIRHARAVGALARARGGEPLALNATVTTGTRTLLAIALENAREGCVRETWGAACAVVQSERARDAGVRAAMRAIARDELAHAALSWDLAAWVASRLTAEERAQVDEECARAVAQLGSELGKATTDPWQMTLGLPTRHEAEAIACRMREEVWATPLSRAARASSRRRSPRTCPELRR